ncbi:TDT family transporter [Sporobolomyces koalae]|uniref:TDT family transporter n=1 Tax=Sporobolomyces koalae TaxID=500713 RepID=UPI003176B199
MSQEPRMISQVGSEVDQSSGPSPDDVRTKWPAGLKRRILHFTPSWFAVNMGTGISSILLHNSPYTFTGLTEIATAIFLINVVLFTLFLLTTIARYCLYPTVLSTMLFHPVQSLFLGCLPMGFATIVNMTVFVAAEPWGGRWITFAWALWWIDVALSVTVAIGVPFFVFTRHQHSPSLNTVSPAWLLPIVAPNVASASGGIVATVLPAAQARLTIMISYLLWGSVPIALMIMTLVYLRMAIHKVPLATEIFSVLLPVGACGQGSFALLQLAYSSLDHTRSNSKWLDNGAVIPADSAIGVASSVWAGSVVIAFVVWAVGIFWISIALFSIIDTAIDSKIPFNMGWWGLTFPLGTHAVAASTFGKQLNSEAFKIVGTIESLVVVLLWLYIGTMTVIKSIDGSVFVAPCLGPTGQPPKEAPRKQRN